MGNIQYSFPELKFEKPVYNQQVPQLNGISKLFETPQLKKPNDLLSSNPFIRRRLLLDMTFDSNIFSNTTTNSVSAIPYIGDDEGKSFADSELGRNLGNLFSSGLNSAGNTVFNNILKKTNLLEGMEQNSLSSLAGAGAGLAANYIGQGISSLGGNSMLSKGIGQGISTGLGTIGGNLTSSLFSEGSKGLQFSGSGLFGETQAGTINPYALGTSMIGTGLSAAFGPSKEYNGKYGSITKGMDNAYDAVQGAVGFIPGYGQGIAAAMALNKGLSNIFGSTDGMTKQDAILGSAFMPAPVKWLNMAGASKTGTFNNLSWLNSEKTTSFMGNAFGNLGKKFDQARDEAGKTYGTFSQGAKRDAQRNIDFANNAWNRILAMADLDELQRIRSLYMTSINNLRYAQMILGGWNPLAIGKQGMKIFNNATNHNMGMRLLSAAALIDNKQMILSALVGTKLYGAKKFRAMSEEELRNRKPEIVVSQTTPKTAEELNAEWERTHPNGGNADSNLSRVSDLTSETFNQTTKPPFTGQEYLEAVEAQRLKKIDKFHEAEKVGESALMADLAVSAAPLLLRGFRWAFNKAGLIVKVPKLTELSAPEIPIDVSNYTGKWKNWVERIQPKLTNKTYNSQKLISIGNASKDKAFLYYKSDLFVKRAKNAGFNDSEISLLQKELLDMLNHSLIKSSSSANNGVHAWADAYLDKSGNLYRNVTSFEPNVQGFSLEDIIGMWDHEFGHVATNMYNSAGRNLGNFMQLVESRYPMIVKMMKYNESIAPKFKSELENLYNFWHSSDIKTKLKESYPELSELELKEFINKYLKFSENIKEYIGNSNELRSRALSTLFAALRKGKSAYLYILENSEDLNAARELDNIFESQSLKKYLDNFLNYSVPITTMGGATYVSTKQ